ncbi:MULTISPECIES: hypothetical protein [Roseobacteraceae]|uniref:Exosortase n=1 Tax=Pseudosulfitobacter pseudonitzschiae TaxID=1402135 RepID=A0A221K042_9RHOB|nr:MULTISPECIES: hypothetical protein [Roseobacteraceae]ASM72378.1 exosortase [Pseudosulfitobacter pseudonitzschiae]
MALGDAIGLHWWKAVPNFGDAISAMVAAHVFASSLHGLIVSDAYGVPKTWVTPTGQDHLKHHDYAAGVGRSLIAPVALGDIAGFDLATAQAPQAYAQEVARARAALKTTFPAPWRAAPHMASA